MALSTITDEEIAEHHAQRARLLPIAEKLGLDYERAVRDDEHRLLFALDVIDGYQQRARVARSTSAKPGTHVAAARSALADLHAAQAQHDQQRPASARSLDDAAMAEAVARQLLGLPAHAGAEGSR